jgi:hypothetical protein
MATGEYSFDEYVKSYERCYFMPLDELELHIFLRNMHGEKSKDEYEDHRKNHPTL